MKARISLTFNTEEFDLILHSLAMSIRHSLDMISNEKSKEVNEYHLNDAKEKFKLLTELPIIDKGWGIQDVIEEFKEDLTTLSL